MKSTVGKTKGLKTEQNDTVGIGTIVYIQQHVMQLKHLNYSSGIKIYKDKILTVKNIYSNHCFMLSNDNEAMKAGILF